ncbi:MAG: futalosine hydrolase [Desulfotignum sp.]|nr:futalosine hydrolase [Desulfotignum sp.]
MTDPVLILCATRLEMAEFLDRHLSRRVVDDNRGISIYAGADRSWVLSLSGPGVFNTARALTVCLERYRPKFILHTGIAGMFADTGLDLGDAAVAVRETYVHAGVEVWPDADLHRVSMRLDPLPFDLIPEHGLTRQGIYDLDSGLAISCTRLLGRYMGCRVIHGPFITVSAITGSFKKAGALAQTFSPVMESMEGAAAAHVAALYQVPMVEIRAASNRAGERDKTRWDMAAAVHTVADVCDTILEKGGDHGI